MQCITGINAIRIHTINGNVCHAEQKWDIMCKIVPLQPHQSNKNTHNTVVISADDILQM